MHSEPQQRGLGTHRQTLTALRATRPKPGWGLGEEAVGMQHPKQRFPLVLTCAGVMGSCCSAQASLSLARGIPAAPGEVAAWAASTCFQKQHCSTLFGASLSH